MLPIVFLGPKPRAASNHFESLLDFLAVDPSRILLIDRPLWIDDLFVPAPGIELELSTNLEFLRFLHSKISARNDDHDNHAQQGRSCYLSRSRLGEAFRTGYGEKEFEQWLSVSGTTVISPETLPLREQISLVNSFDRSSGLIGSQMHNLIFRPEGRPCDVVYLCGGDPKPNFFQLDLMYPGQKTYCQAASYDPLFEFGHGAPFHLRLDRARVTMGRVEKIENADADTPSILPNVEFIHAWFRNFFESRVFGRRAVAGTHDFERSAEWLISMINTVAERSTRPLGAQEVAEAIRAFDETASRYRMGPDQAPAMQGCISPPLAEADFSHRHSNRLRDNIDGRVILHTMP